MLHSGCVKLHQKFRDFVGLPMGLLREESPKNRMNTGLFGSRSGNTVSKQPVALRSSARDNRFGFQKNRTHESVCDFLRVQRLQQIVA